MTERQDEKAAAIQARADEKRKSVRAGKARSKSDDFNPTAEVETIERPVKCAGCGKVFKATGARFGTMQGGEFVGRTMLPSRCEACVAEDDTAVVGASNVLESLKSSGFNVRRHSRATLADFSSYTFRGKGERDVRLMPIIEEWLTAVRDLKSWQEVGSLYLVGPTGTGKTSLMAAMARSLFESGYSPSVVFVRARALIGDVQELYTPGARRGEGVKAMLDKLRKCGVLFLDDAGTEKVTADAFRIIEDLLDAREGWPTVWSSNDGPDELVARWAREGISTHRFRSRLAGFRFIPVEGPDRRFGS